jgi:hypothetical protein
MQLLGRDQNVFDENRVMQLVTPDQVAQKIHFSYAFRVLIPLSYTYQPRYKKKIICLFLYFKNILFIFILN